MILINIIPLISSLCLAPGLLGIINRTKAHFAGRNGQPILQPYFDIYKLLQKGVVYSKTTTWVFRVNPLIGLSAMLLALVLLPMGNMPGLLHFKGDLFLLIYIAGLARFFMVVAALDTGSSFEGMGASREVQFSALAEPALLLGLAALARITGELSLSSIYSAISLHFWMLSGTALIMVVVALFIVLLSENARIPVDDPTTHLELTMIHEVMVLDYSGPDFAMILYSAALKFWIFSSLVVGLIMPRSGFLIIDIPVFLAGMALLAVITGVVESCMARLRMLKVPELLIGAGVLSILALMLVML